MILEKDEIKTLIDSMILQLTNQNGFIDARQLVHLLSIFMNIIDSLDNDTLKQYQKSMLIDEEILKEIKEKGLIFLIPKTDFMH
jgi:hypothetical protein